MKISPSLSALALFSAVSMLDISMVAAASTLRGVPAALPESTRQLIDEDPTFYFIVSHISEDEAWCITAVEGEKEFGNLKLHLCDFDERPTNQLFYPDYSYGNEWVKIASAFDNKCITINYGEALFDGVRARLADCNDTELNDFAYAGDGNFINVAAAFGEYCLTNVGPNPNPNDFIHVKPCQERPDFLWSSVPAAPIDPPHYDYFHLQSGGGCAVPDYPESTKIFLESCDEYPDRRWRLQPVCSSIDDGPVLLVSEVDDSMCLRAGQGDDVEKGTMMRLLPCDIEDELQYFVYDGSLFQLSLRPGLCMVYRGTNANIGVDPIIMKTCNDNQDGWTTSYLI